jgi:predicted acetyltransferase
LQWIVHEGLDGPDGMLAWKPTRDFELDGSHGAITVDHFAAASDDAYRDLWAYLGGIELIDEVTLEGRPIDEPARLLMADGRALRQRYAGDFVWLRLLDVPAALQARSYACEGRLVLELVDAAVGGYAAGRFLLEAGPDGATCVPTTESADLTLPASALAAAYLGGHSVRALAIRGGVEETTPGSLSRLDAMLSVPLAPWCQTWF